MRLFINEKKCIYFFFLFFSFCCVVVVVVGIIIIVVLLLVFVCVCLFVCLLWRLLFLEWGHTGVFAFDASMDVFIDKSYPVVNAVYNITSGGSGGKNQCNPSQGCNVCDACCKSYIKVGHHVTRGRRCSNNKQTAKQLQGQPTASGQASQLNQMLQQTLP